ncbi:spermatogenesis associated 6-like protein [Hyla sarda]|uniref:spermatogenesis associated 6-like protein n=1 Tax=Hyla sarda TaxID=327740 RepID=UPI0024C2C548|nr:spermatogenesis associated 6-like protein [Hyla sarda]XP_056378256.1 spermatogenesis associated 6-like protein [Hyla sarda]
MPLKVVVELQIHAVTCPGVFLPDKDDVFLNVSILGQSKETRSLPAVFPLLFHEKMRFEKVFQKALDPAAVVESLEKRTAGFELIQLNQLGDDVLATYKENHRDFFFPEPKLTPPYPGVDREVLMKTVPGFPGIAPKIEFSTITTIKETPNGPQKQLDSMKTKSRRSLQNSPNRRSKSPSKGSSSPEKCYSSPTRSSQSHSPSPYTRRRMCELNKDSQQRLADLHLGNNEFKSDAESRPPFIVKHIDHSKPVGEKTSSQLWSPKSKRCPASKNSLRRELLFDNLHSDTSIGKDWLDIDDLDSESTLDAPLAYSAYSQQDLCTSPVLRGSLRERLRSENNTWESIHNRVRNLLSTHSAKQRLSLDLSKSEVDRILERSSRRSPNSSLEEKLF